MKTAHFEMIGYIVAMQHITLAVCFYLLAIQIASVEFQDRVIGCARVIYSSLCSSLPDAYPVYSILSVPM